VFCAKHYADLEEYLLKHSSITTVQYFVKTRGMMKEDDPFERFYKTYVSKL
jgi:hypothetical protein